ncbi:MAG: hypothetical protein M3Q07_11880 [Pseudobdellovibrionaceae bacterium]|nr:hypothetical protein [Pseudobdellovibrionaceae bacterium]
MRRWARIVVFLVLAIVGLELLWVMAASRYLKSDSFRELLQKGGLQITFDKASSPLPGHIHVEGLILTTPETRLELPEARLQFSLLALAGKKIIFWSAKGKGGNLSFKPSASPGEDQGPAPGSTGEGASSDDEAWTVHFQKLAFKNLQSLVIGTMSVKGSIDFAAELHVEKQDQVRLRAGRLHVREAQTQWKDQKLARIDSLHGRFELEPFTMKDEWLRKLSLDMKVQAELEEGQVLQNFVVDAPWLTIKGLNLKTEGRLVLKQGQLAEPTLVTFQSPRLQLELWKELVSGHGSFVIAVDDKLKLDFTIPSFTVDHASNKQVDVSGRDLSLKLVTANRDLLSRDRAWQGALRLPESTIHDLRYFNHFLPTGLGFHFKAGQGRVQLQLDSSSANGNFIRLEAPTALVAYENQEFYGRIKQVLNIDAIDFVQEGFTVPSGETTLNVRPGGKDSQESEWAGQLNLKQGRMQITPSRFEGDLQLKANDLRPLLWIFDPKSKLPNAARKLFRKDNLEAQFHLKADETSYAIDHFKAETADLKLEAWYQGTRDKKRGKLFVRYGSFSAGVGVHDADYKIQLLSSREWFQNRQ